MDNIIPSFTKAQKKQKKGTAKPVQSTQPNPQAAVAMPQAQCQQAQQCKPQAV